MGSEAYFRYKGEVLTLRDQVAALESLLHEKELFINELRQENRQLEYQLYFERRKQMAKTNIEVESSYTLVVADELQKCVDERSQWLKDNPKFQDEYPGLAESIRNEITEFENIIEQLKA